MLCYVICGFQANPKTATTSDLIWKVVASLHKDITAVSGATKHRIGHIGNMTHDYMTQYKVVKGKG